MSAASMAGVATGSQCGAQRQLGWVDDAANVVQEDGYGIIQIIATRGEQTPPDVGTMYRALARMVENLLIEAAVRRSAPALADERRNHYHITDLGQRVAQAEARRLEALTRAARLGGLLTESPAVEHSATQKKDSQSLYSTNATD